MTTIGDGYFTYPNLKPNSWILFVSQHASMSKSGMIRTIAFPTDDECASASFHLGYDYSVHDSGRVVVRNEAR